MTRLNPFTALVISLSLCALAFSGCKKEQPASAPPAPAVVAPPPAPAPAAAVDADGNAVPTFADDKHRHMKAHFVALLKLQDAVLAGKLDDAKTQGKWLAEHESADVPVEWKPYLGEFKTQSKVVADAADLNTAASGAAHLAAACGGCHEAMGAKPRIGKSPITKGAENIKEHMADQLTAIDRMWEGLVVPSDRAWLEGAELLGKVAITEKALKAEKKDQIESATLLASTLKQLSASATKAPKAERPNAFADLLTTCVSCHAVARK